MINRDSDPPGGRTSPQSDHHGSEGGHDQKNKTLSFFIFYNFVVLGPSPPSNEIDRQHHIARQFARHHRLERLRACSARLSTWRDRARAIDFSASTTNAGRRAAHATATAAAFAQTDELYDKVGKEQQDRLSKAYSREQLNR